MGFDTTLSRKEFLAGAGAGLVLPWLPTAGLAAPQRRTEGPAITEAHLESFEQMAGLAGFSAEERKAALPSVAEFRENYRQMREMEIDYSTPPATRFMPMWPQGQTASMRAKAEELNPRPVLPLNRSALNSLTVWELAALIKAKKISSVELTEHFLARLQEYGPKLLCVITLMPERAMREARAADAALARGEWLGPLHGIPYGVKDLFAAQGAPTTWGAEPFVDRVIDEDAAVVRQLQRSGAVLCAKLSLGALAMNDHWHKGRTRNPWNPRQGSSGSSAGSASAMAAGLLPFTIGTETLGSIVSPSHRCRVTGLRPTFGKVDLAGAMALSWTMDKAGPICRTALDCQLVLNALALGPFERTQDTAPRLPALKGLRVGRLANDAALDDEDAPHSLAMNALAAVGILPAMAEFTVPEDAALLGLSVEAAAAFDAITRSGEVNTVKESAWPGIFRAHRYTAAVEYIQSLRARRMVQERFEQEMEPWDVVIASDRGSHLLLTTNLTGHPQLYVPLGDGRGVSLIGRLNGEEALTAVGWALQREIDVFRRIPDLSGL
jgi:Asp-tRNA(Asn)/Glu-tRNA(Gln) amidotransferase A subunit family amidase